MTICYKVCRVENGKYFSEFGHNYPEWDIECKPLERVYPSIGKLFVYLDPAQVIQLIEKNQALLKCYAYGDVEYINYAEFENINKQENFSEYWTTRKVRSQYTTVRSNIALVNSLFIMKVFSTEEVEALRNLLF